MSKSQPSKTTFGTIRPSFGWVEGPELEQSPSKAFRVEKGPSIAPKRSEHQQLTADLHSVLGDDTLSQSQEVDPSLHSPSHTSEQSPERPEDLDQKFNEALKPARRSAGSGGYSKPDTIKKRQPLQTKIPSRINSGEQRKRSAQQPSREDVENIFPEEDEVRSVSDPTQFYALTPYSKGTSESFRNLYSGRYPHLPASGVSSRVDKSLLDQTPTGKSERKMSSQDMDVPPNTERQRQKHRQSLNELLNGTAQVQQADSLSVHETRSSEISPQAPKDVVESEDMLRNIGEIHRYTIEHVNVGTELPVGHLQKILIDQVFTKFVATTARVPLNQTTFFTHKPLNLRNPDTNTKHAAGDVAIYAKLTESGSVERLGADAQHHANDGFVKVFDGHRSIGKVKRRWVKFENPMIVPVDIDDQDGVSAKERCLATINRALASDLTQSLTSDDQIFALWLKHEVIDFSKIFLTMQRVQGVSKQHEINTIVAGLLQGILQNRGERRNNIVLHRNKAFGTQSTLLSSGLVERLGIQGQLVIGEDDGAPKVVTQPCTGLFHNDKQSVAAFLTSYFGVERAAKPNSILLDKMTKMLRGVTVIIAVKDGFIKQTGVVRSIGSSAVERPESLKGLKANISLHDLRYPPMPLVNIGSSERPFYFPAELCRFAPNQMFRGQAPVVDDVNLFKPKAVKAAKPVPVPSSSNGTGPFDANAADGFKLFFVSLKSSEEGKGALRPEIWDMFQHELGQRFDGVLSEAVVDSKRRQKRQLEHNTIERTLTDLARITAGSSGSNIVLIISIPSTLPTEVASAIRAQCDTLTGVQCCLFNTLDKLCAKYLGVPIFLADLKRAMGSNHSNLSVEDEVATNVDDTIYGIHVVDLQDLRPTDAQKCPGLVGRTNYLVSIVSVSSQATQSRVRTTHHIVSASSDAAKGTLEMTIASHLSQHVGSPESRAARAAIYVYGLCTRSEADNRTLAKAFRDYVSQLVNVQQLNDKHSSVQLVLMSPQKKLNVEGVVSVDRVAPALHNENSSRQQKVADMQSELNLQHNTVNQIYRRPDGFREQDGKLRDTSAVWHVVKQDVRSGKSSETLEKRHLPNILHLAQAASERARAYVYLKQDASEGCTQRPTYAVTAVHKDLEHSLFFI